MDGDRLDPKIRLGRIRYLGREADEIATRLELFADHADYADLSLGAERTRALVAAFQTLREIRDECLF